MRNKETMRKLLEMRLSGMVEIYEEQTRNLDYEKMTFNQRFNLIVDYEYSRRQSNKLNRLIKQARFSDSTAAIEDIEYHPDRHLDKDLILELASVFCKSKFLTFAKLFPQAPVGNFLYKPQTYSCNFVYSINAASLIRLLGPGNVNNWQ
jgi:hypothetical protein